MSSINRVRVYELSKELELDTKDILAVCEQLNIAVKSHSSTITESEAELVRAAAPERNTAVLEKNQNKHQERKSSTTVNLKPKESVKEATKEAEPKSAKQQILTVSKPTAQLQSPPAIAVEPPVPPVQPKAPETAETTVDSSNLTSPVGHDLDRDSSLNDIPVQITTPPSRPTKPMPTTTEVKLESRSETLSEPKIETNTAPKAAAVPPIAAKSPVELQTVTLEAKPQEIRPQLSKPIEAKAPESKAPESKVKPSKSETPEVAKPSVAPERSDRTKQFVAVNKPVQPQAPIQPKSSNSSVNQDLVSVKPADRQASEHSSSEYVGSDKPNSEKAVSEKVIAKPKLEKPKLNRPEPQSPNRSAPSRPQINRPTPVKDSVLIERGITGPNDPVRPLRAPMAPPVRPSANAPERPITNGIRRRDEVSAAVIPTTPELLEKPIPAKLAKRGKTKKEDEEQDLLEMKEKARLNKPKRYLRVLEDDDELIDDLDGDDLSQVSLSLARPTARPKQGLPKSTVFPEIKIGGAKLGRKTASRDRRTVPEAPPEKPSKITLDDSITVQELAVKLMLPETDVIRTLFLKGVMVNINQTLDIPTASMVAMELGYEVEQVAAAAPARKVTEMIEAKDFDSLQRRPPVVTIMGHVDHGKTTLLDSIRKSKVAQGEAGGITQHIGAYHVDVGEGAQKQQIVFLDTPGHEAFTAMRARGARVTDVAILVVAADDGVQPQTIEAISHARAAKVPIIVAINKVDKIEAQPDRIRQELTEYGLVDEEWGGDTIMVPVSAIRGENLDTLLEMILLVTEVEDLQANPNRTAKGTVIEAHLDKARGPVATFLIQNGTLRVGDILVAGSAFGKVRAMVDDQGKRVEAATPSFAVEVLGLSDVPAAGDEFEVFTDEKLARATAGDRASLQRHSRLQQSMASRRVTLGTVSAKAQEGELKDLNLILKADVQGSVEAILGALGQLPQQEIQLRVLLSAAGEITENDVDLAAASDAVIIGFNTTMASGARQASDEMGVDVRDYNIIYKLLEDIQGAMEGLLEPELVEEPLGQAEVRALFTIGKGVVAGCYVQSGKLVRNCKVRIKRGNELVHEAPLDSLKRMKDDAKEVAAGFECGISLPKFTAWQEGDIIEAFRMVTKRRTLTM
ncbi:translation initiation factor IF-2 [Tumidithrix elongata RA019]|uniref:Translation initiation factor IF-2 n=1 Tax=Tumidithrix elongata BACA0141 TaxID=2716417 RepID=A0AAW9PUT8_9CYAN|nr:translation initiation factor IF-2 [Tumidithrix elongata RA019]